MGEKFGGKIERFDEPSASSELERFAFARLEEEATSGKIAAARRFASAHERLGVPAEEAADVAEEMDLEAELARLEAEIDEAFWQIREERPTRPAHERVAAIKQAQTLALEVPHDFILAYKMKIEGALGLPLKDRGESHATVIRPMYFKKAMESFGPEDLELLDALQGSHMEVEGIGSFPARAPDDLKKFVRRQRNRKRSNREGTTFFLVLKPPAELEAAMAARPGWNTRLHVTIGFDLADRHGMDKAVNPLLTFESPDEVRLHGLTRQVVSKNERGRTLRSPQGHPLYHYERV